MATVVKMSGKAHVMSCGFTTSSGGSIGEGTAIGINASGEAIKATIAEAAYIPAVGVSLKGDTKGVFGTTVAYDFIEYANTLVKLQNSDWSWTPGGTVWLLSGSEYTQTCPNGDDQMIQKMGHAINATTMQVEIGTPFLYSGGNIKSGI